MQSNSFESGERMKRAYHKPSVKKMDYNFKEQVMASSIPVQTKLDPWGTNEHCTWGEKQYMCDLIFNVSTRGLDNCTSQG